MSQRYIWISGKDSDPLDKNGFKVAVVISLWEVDNGTL